MKIQIKGIRDGLLATLGEGEWADIQNDLLDQIDGQAGFFNGARIALDVGNRTLRSAELGSLRNVLSDKGVSLWAIISQSSATEESARLLGLSTRLAPARTTRPARVQEPVIANPDTAIWVQKTLRSGNRIESQGCVTVLGDVNPGAEIIAAGSVIIWGHLRGGVHAGAQGDTSAVVCALELTPTQLRIANMVAQFPSRRGKPQPSIARIEREEIIIDPWKTKTR